MLPLLCGLAELPELAPPLHSGLRAGASGRGLEFVGGGAGGAGAGGAGAGGVGAGAGVALKAGAAAVAAEAVRLANGATRSQELHNATRQHHNTWLALPRQP